MKIQLPPCLPKSTNSKLFISKFKAMKNKFKFLSIILIFSLYSCKQNENTESSNAVEDENIVHSNATENENEIAIDEDNTNKTINMPDEENIKKSLAGKTICGSDSPEYDGYSGNFEIQNKSISKNTLTINVIMSLQSMVCSDMNFKLLYNWENNNWVLNSAVNEDYEEKLNILEENYNE